MPYGRLSKVEKFETVQATASGYADDDSLSGYKNKHPAVG
jgi:hypothetical protein